MNGCSRGIGKETLNVLSNNGASVFACVRKIDKEFLDYTKKLEVQFKNNISPIEIDLSKEENLAAFSSIFFNVTSINI